MEPTRPKVHVESKGDKGDFPLEELRSPKPP